MKKLMKKFSVKLFKKVAMGSGLGIIEKKSKMLVHTCVTFANFGKAKLISLSHNRAVNF